MINYFLLGYSAEMDQNSYLTKDLNKNKVKDTLSLTTRKTKDGFDVSGDVDEDKDAMEVKKWSLKKLTSIPKTERITEQRCGLHDNDPNYKKKYGHRHHKH